jgi:hypothetical protein
MKLTTAVAMLAALMMTGCTASQMEMRREAINVFTEYDIDARLRTLKAEERICSDFNQQSVPLLLQRDTPAAVCIRVDLEPEEPVADYYMYNGTIFLATIMNGQTHQYLRSNFKVVELQSGLYKYTRVINDTTVLIEDPNKGMPE